MFDNLLIRCSALGKIMGAGRNIGLTDKQKEDYEALLIKPNLTPKQQLDKERLYEKSLCKYEFDLSETAKTYIKGLVKEKIFMYDTEVTSKQMEKGLLVEDKAIELYNSIFFKNYEKNTIKMHNDFIQGTCDIDAPSKIIDIKSSWTLETFPATKEEGKNEDYEWQGRGYMWIYDKPFFELAYCFIDTPDSLLDWENNLKIHQHIRHFEGDNGKMVAVPIKEELLVTVLKFERDIELEEKIKYKVGECRRFANYYANQILSKNN